MEPIDKPFRFTLDFCVVWGLLAAPTFLLTRQMDFGPWYSRGALLILLPLFAALALYGPVLIARQVARSGIRGKLVLRTLVAIILWAILLFWGLWISGFYTSGNARVLAFIFVAVATGYLHWRTAEKRR